MPAPLRSAVLVDAIRTPIAKGKPDGAFASTHPVDLHAHVLRSLITRNDLDPALVDDVIGGAVGQVGEQSGNTARWATLAAGFPESVPAVTIDRQCGSSQQAIHFAAQGVMSGAYDIAIASGVESMSQIPIGSQTLGRDVTGPQATARYDGGLVPQGISAELIAEKWGLNRTQLDEFAVLSHHRATQAHDHGLLATQIAPYEITHDDGSVRTIYDDESVRPSTSLDMLARLRPAFKDDRWVSRYPSLDFKVTAGNSSPVNDGAAAVLVAEEEAARRVGLTPRARLHSFAVTGDDPVMMLTGIIPATAAVLDRAGLTLTDIDAFEVNEAFSSVVLAWLVETGADPAKVNVNGGALAIGHPLGASGARLMTSLLSVLDQYGGRFGLQVMCEAGGMANATIVERL